MSNKLFIGIDPGAKGAMCAIYLKGDKPPQIEFIDNGCTTKELFDWMKMCHNTGVTMCMIENVHSIPSASAKANFTFGWNVGMLHTLLKIQNFGYDVVSPKKWQKEVGITVPLKFKGSIRKNRIKNTVAETCDRIYPGCEIWGPKGGLKDGRSDALMIAHYCRLKYSANTP